MLTGLRPQTFENLQLNAGVFLVDFDYGEIQTKTELEEAVLALLESGEGVLGMTTGGGSFNCTPTTRTIEGDGMRYPFVGSTVYDMWTVTLSTTLKEITPENFALALGSADINTNEGGTRTTVTVRTDLKKEDYKPRLCWIGDTSQGFAAIEITNALNTTGAAFTFTDRGEGTLPVTFQGHVSDIKNQGFAPCKVDFFKDAA